MSGINELKKEINYTISKSKVMIYFLYNNYLIFFFIALNIDQ